MNTFRLFSYLGFCIGTVWCVTNTPMGEFVLRNTQFVQLPPQIPTTSKGQDEFYKRVVAQQRKQEKKWQELEGQEPQTLDDHFKDLPQGETRYIPAPPLGFDPHATAQPSANLI